MHSEQVDAHAKKTERQQESRVSSDLSFFVYVYIILIALLILLLSYYSTLIALIRVKTCCLRIFN